MPAIHVSKSITIQASSEKIFKILSDFHHWPAWSPWLITEPEAKVKIQPDGKFYSWEGKRTGSGEMKVVSEKIPNRLDLQVTFIKPWKSSAPVWFELNSNGGATEVVWHMDSKLPFFMFWIKKMMMAYIGMDYSRGLMMLKDYVENGKVHSSLNFKGIHEYAGCNYVGVSATCTMEALDKQMEEDFTKLFSWSESHSIPLAGSPLTIYHLWDIVNHKVRYTAALPLLEIPTSLPAGFNTGNIPSLRVYTIEHTGPYKFLGNAYTTHYSMQRAKEYGYKKGVDPFESYVNLPGEVSDHDLITAVHFPVK